MPAANHRKFSRVDFLDSVDKPRYLAPLLVQHASFFAQHGLDVRRLENTRLCSRKLFEIFTHPMEPIPPTLYEELEKIANLANAQGYDWLLEEAEFQGITISEFGHSMTAADFVMAVREKHPELVERCYQENFFPQARRYTGFQSQDLKRIDLRIATNQCPMLSEWLSHWFRQKHYGGQCEVYVFQELNCLQFQVTHGSLCEVGRRRQSSPDVSSVVYRPVVHDIIRYDMRSGLLCIHARFQKEIETYRTLFGTIFFEYEHYFETTTIYTLKPLLSMRPKLQQVPGISGARLVEAGVKIYAKTEVMSIFRGLNLLDSPEIMEIIVSDRTRLVHASIDVEDMQHQTLGKVSIHPPNAAVFELQHHQQAVEEFVRANGFLVLQGETWPWGSLNDSGNSSTRISTLGDREDS